MTTQKQLDSFYRFASQEIQSSEHDLCMDELLRLWKERSDEAEFSDSAAAVRIAVAEMKNGDAGMPYEQFVAEMRQRHNTSSTE